jgi:hypothetical protein
MPRSIYDYSAEQLTLSAAVTREHLEEQDRGSEDFTPAEEAWLAAFRREPDA